PPPPPPRNHLYYGDNFWVLRNEIASESVDLVYLDPPFNSNANYNILFKSPAGTSSDAQIEAFEDTWHWNDHAEDAFDQVARSGNTKAFDLLNAMRSFLGENDMMAYLAMMAVRLIELHRVLKPTGSLYLHCDPTASHYLKLLLDGVFGADKFRSEISWKRSSAHNDAKQGRVQYGNIRDVIYFYTKSSDWTWHWQYTAYDQTYVDSAYRHADDDGRRYRRGDLTAAKPGGDVSYGWPVKRAQGASWVADLDGEFLNPKAGWEYKQVPPYKGRYWAFSKANMTEFARQDRLAYSSSGMPEFKRYLDEQQGVPLQNDWHDILPASGSENLGYPTQKPLALLERIIAASSKEGDVVLDPFCGCGTAIHAAQKLGRQWIGIDVTHLAISLIEKRLRAAFPGIEFTVEGTPKDLASAEDLAARDKYQFQWWAVSMVDAMPFGGKKKGADGGIDGIIYFKPDGKRTEKALVSVKGGDNVGVQMIRDLHSAMEREKSPIGVFITKALPTGVMEKEAAAVGRFHSEATGKSYPRLQIITLAELFQGKRPDIPYVDPTAAFKKAGREETAKQPSLL
ncbi:DNA methyltransferase, partial [Sphingomonas sp.]|uniref:DNA methyltransferase n=1 Tax=Sphingomonas sp. TaxID=28214 RepID=UPI0039C99A5B